MENVVIAGAGPAGLTAAIYVSRAELKPLVLEGPEPGGQMIVSNEVENFPGFPEPVSGMEIVNRQRKQTERLGARFRSASVEGIRRAERFIEVDIGKETIQTRAFIIATGAVARRLPVEAEQKFYGKGISGCATCDGAFFRESPVLVVGGGDTAMQDAVFLAKFARKVTIVHRRDYLKAAPVEVERAKHNSKIKWMIPWVVEDITGDTTVTGAVLKNTRTGETRSLECEGIFVAIGHSPQTNAFKGTVDLTDEGFVMVKPGTSKTSIPGVFACGDVCNTAYKQAIIAAGHGCIAALDVERYLADS